MIEQELGLSLVEIFSEISPEPVAAASLGQVHTFGINGVFFLLIFIEF
jgi:predicted unusual protein kinase regulating ubiquinone biosynthesis (AarF/ABC1/UbiB family)